MNHVYSASYLGQNFYALITKMRRTKCEYVRLKHRGKLTDLVVTFRPLTEDQIMRNAAYDVLQSRKSQEYATQEREAHEAHTEELTQMPHADQEPLNEEPSEEDEAYLAEIEAGFEAHMAPNGDPNDPNDPSIS